MTDRKIAVVFVAYGCVPVERLRAHFAWNQQCYHNAGAFVYYVTGKRFGCRVIPPQGTRGQVCYYSVREEIFPPAMLPHLSGKPVFSLTKTKNHGIKCALNDGADVIICTDVDIAFSQSAWDIMCEVETGQAIMPVYHLAADFKSRNDERPRRVDHGMSGTTAMTAEDWGRVQYDERCIGYGADDGILLRDIERAGIELVPPYREHPAAPIVWHIDHATDDDGVNVPGAGRDDCWGRKEGFNPDNFKANQLFHLRKARP